MSLDKGDLKEIKKIVDTSVTKVVDDRVSKSEAYLEDKIEFSVSQSEERLESRMDKVDKRMNNVEKNLSQQIDGFRKDMHKEIDSLSDIHQLAFKKIDKNVCAIKNHEVRIKRLEAKV